MALDTPNRCDFTGDDVYTALARKMGLIEQYAQPLREFEDHHHQVIDMAGIHHKLHASCAFYRSGFDSAVALIVDGAGTFFSLENNEYGGTHMLSLIHISEPTRPY